MLYKVKKQKIQFSKLSVIPGKQANKRDFI